MYITVGNCQLLFEFTEKLAPGLELPTPTSDTSMFISNCPPKPLLWGWATPLILWQGGKRKAQGKEDSPRVKTSLVRRCTTSNTGSLLSTPWCKGTRCGEKAQLRTAAHFLVFPRWSLVDINEPLIWWCHLSAVCSFMRKPHHRGRSALPGTLSETPIGCLKGTSQMISARCFEYLIWWCFDICLSFFCYLLFYFGLLHT